MDEYIEKPDMQYILHIRSNKKVEKRLIDYCLESVVDVFEDTGLTADVQPAKRGRWTGDEVIQCSNCNFTLNGTSFGRIVHKYFSYCPKCGADMRNVPNTDVGEIANVVEFKKRMERD